jgi:hypothetical protein
VTRAPGATLLHALAYFLCLIALAHCSISDNQFAPTLLPGAIEDCVAADAPVRVIDAFVNELDASGLGFGWAVI